MKFESSVVAIALASWAAQSTAFQSVGVPCYNRRGEQLIKTRVAAPEVEAETKTDLSALTLDIISKLRFREAKEELERRALDTGGTLSDMRSRLRELVPVKEIDQSNPADESVRVIDEEVLNSAFQDKGIAFEDNSDPDFDFKSRVEELYELSERLHWKKASRKLKQLNKRFGTNSEEAREIPEKVFTDVLKALMHSRLHGARAAESARKAMEVMVQNGHTVPAEIANSCIKDSLGWEKDGSHEGFAGIDTALAMLTAVEVSEDHQTPIFVDTYEKLITTLANEGSIDYALQLLREIVVEKADTPSLKVFSDVAMACVESANEPEKLMTGLAYVKATGYDLENIASTVDGRGILAAGVIASEKMDNVGLGLRFLTAASKAEGCDPDRGDTLVANLSPASQRASTIIHRQAINKAVENKTWKLAVKLLELMIDRGLTPSPSVWRNVVNLCAKEEKSRKATGLLLDWIDLWKQGRAEKPPLKIFNTVVNACEVCGEEELTVQVLDAMKETHDTEGNLITFNIALKRLAKQGNTLACEGIIVGMLQGGIEPSVVSYTTAIAACVSDPKKSDVAFEWIKRMKSRLVQPNVITYNTALASCMDGSVEGTKRAGELSSLMIADVKNQVESGIIDPDDYTNVIPNFYTRTVAKSAIEQLDDQVKSGDIDEEDESTARKSLMELVDYLKSDLSELADKQKNFVKDDVQSQLSSDGEITIEEDAEDEELEYSVAISTHRAAMV